VAEEKGVGAVDKRFIVEQTLFKNLPSPLFAKEGFIPPFGKGR
jgi:hypothetical protein